jgi:hypothetical protein
MKVRAFCDGLLSVNAGPSLRVASASPASNESARVMRESVAHNREVGLDGTAMGWSAKGDGGAAEAGR